MKFRKIVASALVAVAATTAVGLGTLALMTATATPAEAARCICPQVYAPVVCDHNKTYPNQCVADCHHAKNCVPAGIF